LSGSVTFRLFDEVFSCNTVRKLIGCDNSQIYYVADYLSFSGIPITTGTTFIADIVSPSGSDKLCLFYDSDVDGSSTSYVTQVYSIETDCNTCEVPATPTPTPTMTTTPTITPTPSVTPSATVNASPTPTPSREVTYVYAYVKCETDTKMIIQPVQVPGATTSNAFKFGNDCWKLYGVFAQPWSPPSIYNPVTYNYNYFGMSITLYDNCDTCLTPPPTPSNSPILSPTPTPSAALTCLYYEISNYSQFGSGSGIDFTYNDCNGILQNGSVMPESEVTICSSTYPIVPFNGVVTPLNTPCN